jgi:hypothetical protein
MPTGYTSKIADGIDFKTFALDCARAFGACIMLRDEPGGGDKIPQKFEPDPYYLKILNDKKYELENFDSKYTDEYCIRMIEMEHRERFESNNIHNKKSAELEKKYRDMLASVNNWNPPTADHVGLKNFMIQQITDSIKWDCHYYAEDEKAVFKKPKKKDIKQWRQGKLNSIQRDVRYYEDRYNKECERLRKNNEWIADLRKSLE